MGRIFTSRTKAESAALLADFDALLRAKPEALAENYGKEESIEWFGRASALMNKWDRARATSFETSTKMMMMGGMNASRSVIIIMTEIQKARHDLLLEAEQPLTISIEAGKVFDYYDEVKNKIDTATHDLFFVDPYLDHEFVSRYLVGIKSEVIIRLLTTDKKLSTLVPAVKLLKEQQKQSIEIKINDFHDRFLFVDGTDCYQSTSSFKDGPKKSPTAISQIVDAFDPLFATYQKLWDGGTLVPTE